MSGFYRVSYQPRVLAGWITGPNARYMETLSEEKLRAGVDKIFEIFLKRYFTIDPQIKYKLITSKWHSNPFSRGSYSARKLQTDRMRGSAKNLSIPLKRNKNLLVLFAGEATHPRFYSTVHGASASGYREAERLIKL